MMTNLLGEISIFAYFLYLTIKPTPALQTHYKIIIIMMVVIFIVTYLLSFLEIIYNMLWYLYKSRKNKVIDADKDFPVQNQDTKSKPKADYSKGKGKAVDPDIPTW
jgi:hypothetical protein